MAYSELIKNFSKIREYISQFFIYGFKSRNEYDSKSARSYDNERRRIESWLGDYMSFRQNPDGKNVFFAVDSRSIPSNPLYNAFKAKSFTSNDITLNFCILDMFVDCDVLSAGEIAEKLSNEYFSVFENCAEKYHKFEDREEKRRPDTLVLELTDERNALERVMHHFSYLKKETEKLDDKHYRITLEYDRDDETEILIRILSFGPLVKVISPQSFINKLKNRINKQISCGF